MVSLGYLFARRGDAARAERWYARAVAAAPRHAEARLGLASTLFDLSRDGEVRVHLREALSAPGAHLARAHALDGRVRERAGDLDGALASFRAAFGSAPDDAEIRGLLGLALHHRQRDDEALVHLREARRLGLDAAEVHLVVGVILTGRGHERAGIDALRDALRARPDWPVAANNLAWHLATTRDPSLRDADEAILLAERAALATGRRDVEVLDTLATALAAAGRRSDALRVAGEALARARESGDAETIRAGEARLATTRAAGDAPGAARGAP
jgi:tetratricopeptide (TPR) repeat protein